MPTIGYTVRDALFNTQLLVAEETEAGLIPVQRAQGADGAPLASAANQDEQTALLTSLETKLDTVITNTDRAADAAESTTPVSVSIDQTTPGTTNRVNIEASLRASTGAKSSVNSGTSSVSILAANANRKGATIYNTDANVLYLDLSGGTASATSCSVPVAAGAIHSVPFGYTGAITGVWASDGSGAALVTEFA